MPSLDIIIVNWNAGHQLRECLESIINTKYEGFTLQQVVVVDNASSDDSLIGLEPLALPLAIIKNIENRGFGAACNQGAAKCKSDYLLFLNPDTKLFSDSLMTPFSFMQAESNNAVGICGIQLVDESGFVARSCARFPSLSHFIAQALGLNKLGTLNRLGVHMEDWDHLSTQPVDHVIGAFFFMRHEVFLRLKGFDERFFVYLEDLDFSLRAKLVAWDTVYLSSAQAFHLGGGASQQVKAIRLFYSIRSRLIYGFKHFPLWKAWSLLMVSMFVEPITRILFCMFKKQWTGVIDTLQGYRMLWGALGEIVRSHH